MPASSGRRLIGALYQRGPQAASTGSPTPSLNEAAMTLMLSPVPGRIYVVSSGAVYNSDQTTGIIVNVVTVQDVSDLIAAGCAVVNPPPTDVLFTLKAANFNSTADQLLVPSPAASGPSASW